MRQITPYAVGASWVIRADMHAGNETCALAFGDCTATGKMQ
jgi:hypothetical protein